MNTYITALNQELAYLRDKGGKRYKVTNGRRLTQNSNEIVYSFETDIELYLPDAAPVRLELGQHKVQGEVLVNDKFELIITVGEDLGERVPIAYLSCEPWKLLEGLAIRLREAKERNPSGLQEKLMNEGPTLWKPFGSHELLKGSKIAKNHGFTEPITMIWGPPGTGKTQTLAEIAIMHMLKGRRVAILSHSNVSVDGAIKRIISLVEKNNKNSLLEQGKILRYGYVREEILANHPYGTAFNYALQKFPKLKEEKETLEERKALLLGEGKHLSKERVENEKKLQNIRLKLKEAEKEVIKEAQIIATTISKATVDTLFYDELKFDVVIFDEASMAYIPQIEYACSLAQQHFICLGDFKQLAPIAQGDSSSQYLTQDIYSYLHISTEEGQINYHPWLVLLDVQWRMHPYIAEFSNKYVYQKLIKHHISVKEKGLAIAHKEPFQGKALVVVDLSGMYTVSGKNSDNSRFNIMSALISVHLALEAEKSGHESISIITPYAGQARLIRAILYDCTKNKMVNIMCSTVHQFQGSESDVVIFDAVESYRQTRTGKILTDNTNQNVVRLMNVAITRAKGKFIVVAHQGFWQNKLMGKNNLLLEVFKYIKEKGVVIREKELKHWLSNHTHNPIKCYLEQESYKEKLQKDLAHAKHEIYISWPKGKITDQHILEEEFSKMLQHASHRGVNVIIQAEHPQSVSKVIREYVIPVEESAHAVLIIDGKTIWYGAPKTDVAFTAEGTHLRIRQWLPMRVSGEKTASIMQTYIEQNDHQLAHKEQQKESVKKLEINGFNAYITSNHTCPECGAPLVLKKGKKHYIGCTSCKHTQFITLEVLNTYLIKKNICCPIHGISLVGRLSKYGVYVQCKYGNESHIVSLDDL